jgi:ribosomal protein L15
MTENRKVRTLLNGIIDPALEAAVCQVRASDAMQEDFNRTMNYLAQYAHENESRKSKQRNISEFNTNRKPGRGGRGSGRGNRGGRGGRGGRSGNNRSSGKDPKAPHRYYSAKEWNDLSEAEKQSIRDLRDNYKKRKQAAVSTEREEEDNKKARSEEKDNQVGNQMNRRPDRG